MSKRKIILIGGGTRSGKSTLALLLARRLGERRVFLATGQPGDDEMRERIQRHRQSRGDDFHTVEEPLAVSHVLGNIKGQDVIILDCLTLWLANLLLSGKHADDVLGQVEELVGVLRSCAAHIIIVTNEVGMGIVPDNALARAFRDLQGQANQRIAREADEIYLAVLGTILQIKPMLALLAVEEPPA